MLTRVFIFIIISLSLVMYCQARIELVTVPTRESVSINIDRNNNVLVQEIRTITVKQGKNIVQFDWSNINIDIDTVQVQLPSSKEDIDFGSMSIPPGSRNSIMWDVQSSKSIELPVKIAYKVDGVSWKCDYIALIDENETFISLKSEITVTNRTQDKYENVKITIESENPFTISLDSQESEKVELFDIQKIPIEKTYTSDPSMYGNDIAVHYVFKNIRDVMLLSGKVRLYKMDKNGSIAFLGEDSIGFIPSGGEIKLYTGNIRDVKVERNITSQRMINVRKDVWGNITVYDTDESYKVVVKSHKKDVAKVIIVVHLNDLWESLESNKDYIKKDGNTIEFSIKVEPNKEETINLRIIGRNLTQGFITSY